MFFLLEKLWKYSELTKNKLIKLNCRRKHGS